MTTLQMAGRLELSGPERLVMEGQRIASVDTQRSVAIRDNWPLRTADLDDVTPSPTTEVKEPLTRPKLERAPGRKSYSRLTAALNADVSRSAGERKSDGKHGWRGRLNKALRRLASETAAASTVRLLIEYSSHRLKHGGERVSKLSQRTLHKEVTRFGSVLLDVLGGQSLLLLEGHEIQAAYLAVVLGKPKATRPDVLEELVKFHRYLESVHHVADVDFEPLRSVCGPRVRSLAPGSFSNAEVDRVLADLMADLERERARPDMGPQDARACALRVLAFILLEASGIRPSSIHGLVLGDFHLLGSGSDFLHVHGTGEYGETKTLASVGFISLKGSIWAAHRDWVLDWISQERTLAGQDWWKRPVFAESAGSRRRFARSYLSDRIGRLLKWVVDDSKARVYWLRKRRITARMEAAFGDPASVPRIVYQALCEAGHADIRVTIESYVHDASVPLLTYLQLANTPDRAAIIGSTGLPSNALDQAWHRNRRAGELQFYGEVLDRLGTPVAATPGERVTSPPELYRQKPLVPVHVDVYARALQHFGEPVEAREHSGISATQAEALDRAVAELVVRIGTAPWRVEGVRQNRGVMAPARRLSETDGLFALMDTKTTEWLEILLDLWLQQGYIRRLYGEGVVLVLGTPEEVGAAEKLIESTKARLQIGSARGMRVLVAGGTEKEERNSHTSALRWVLAMHWLHRELSADDNSQVASMSD